MDAFKSNEALTVMEEELLELEKMLDRLRRRQKVLKSEYNRIQSLPNPKHIDDSEIELVYNQFKANLGDAVVKSLNDVVGFKNRVEEFQRGLMNQRARELEQQIKEISEQIRLLDEQYEKDDKQKRLLEISKQQELLNIDAAIEELADELKSFTMTISDIHEAVMGNRECSFEIKSNQSVRSKTPININLRIFDDGSHSVDPKYLFMTWL